MYEYLNDYRLWLSALVVLAVYKVFGYVISGVFRTLIDDIKSDAIEEYKKNREGKNNG